MTDCAGVLASAGITGHVTCIRDLLAAGCELPRSQLSVCVPRSCWNAYLLPIQQYYHSITILHITAFGSFLFERVKITFVNAVLLF
jgi:hypothetical protein